MLAYLVTTGLTAKNLLTHAKINIRYVLRRRNICRHSYKTIRQVNRTFKQEKKMKIALLALAVWATLELYHEKNNKYKE